MYFHTYIRFFVFFARSTAADNFRTLCAGRTDDRRRQQQQQCREHATTSWLQRYTCCIAHSCFCWTLGSVIEDRAGTCELLLLLLSTWSAVCVIDATGTAMLCCPAARHRQQQQQQQQSSSHIMHQVPGITYWCKKSFVRVQSCNCT